MKTLSIGEKFDLIRYHGAALSKAGASIPLSKRSEVIASAERIIARAQR